MKKLTLLVAAAVVLTISGCSASPLSGTAPVALASARPTASATPSPPATPESSAGSATPTPTPSAEAPTDSGTVTITTPDPQPVQPAQPEQPSPAPVDPNAVDPAGYPSHAVDPINHVSLAGVEFMTADGNIICGIQSAYDGVATCTPSTWKTIIPQPVPDEPNLHAVEVTSSSQGAMYLYPDWFSQPARTIPVLPDGKSITLGMFTCSVSGAAVTCTNVVYNKGFTVSTAAVIMHN